VLHQEVPAAIYRVAFQQRFGLPSSLQERMRQESLAAAFAGEHPTEGLEHAGEVIASLGALALASNQDPVAALAR
jgi:hypothetical protein